MSFTEGRFACSRWWSGIAVAPAEPPSSVLRVDDLGRLELLSQ
jgi:hypothetical protein